MVPEVSWVLGPWDTSACECGANGALEVAEVTCSRGSWLLCSGAVGGYIGKTCEHSSRPARYPKAKFGETLQALLGRVNISQILRDA